MGSVIDGHPDLIRAIKNQISQNVTELLWAGELTGDTNGVKTAHETAGILRMSFRTFKVNVSVDHLSQFFQKNIEAQKIFITSPFFLNFVEHPEHLEPALEQLSDFRHTLLNLGLHIDFGDGTEIQKRAKKIDEMMTALSKLKAPIPELDEFKTLLQPLLKGDKSDRRALARFFEILNAIADRNLSTVATVIQ